MTPNKIKDALESVPQADVEDWLKESIGQSTLSKRRKAFPKMEQNQGEKHSKNSVQI